MINTLALKLTIGSKEWMKLNASQIFFAIPAEWKPISECILPIGFALKAAGVQWTELNQVVLACHWFVRISLAESQSEPTTSLRDIRIRRCQSLDEWRGRCYG